MPNLGAKLGAVHAELGCMHGDARGGLDKLLVAGLLWKFPAQPDNTNPSRNPNPSMVNTECGSGGAGSYRKGWHCDRAGFCVVSHELYIYIYTTEN